MLSSSLSLISTWQKCYNIVDNERFLTCILHVDAGVERNVLLLHRDLQSREKMGRNTEHSKRHGQNNTGMRFEGGRTTPLARARGTGDAPARETEGVPVALMAFNAGLRC